MVRVKIAMNGQDYVDSRQMVCIWNAPKMQRVEPAWVFAYGETPMTIHGKNLIETGNIYVRSLRVCLSTLKDDNNDPR